MAPPTAAARSLCALLRSATSDLHPSQPLRLIAKRRVPLTRQGELLGHLEALFRVTFRAGAAAEGVLVFDWPDATAEHSAVLTLEEWRGRCDGHDARRLGAVTVECRRGELESGPGTHLKIRAPASDLPDDLIDLACRVGLDQQLRDPLERALAAAGDAAAAKAAEADPVLPPEDQARVDSIVHGAEFDSAQHPTVDINTEVTNSQGVRFRLLFKRSRGVRRRLWVKVPQRIESVVPSNGVRAHA